jgi:hypothetical protein
MLKMNNKVKILSQGVVELLKDPAFAAGLEDIAKEALRKNGLNSPDYETEISYTRKDRAQINIKNVSPNAFKMEAETGNLNRLAGGS